MNIKYILTFGKTSIKLINMDKSSTSLLSTRNLIVLKSLPFFIKKGMYGITLSDFSRALKMSKPAILYHFRKPEDIFLALMDSWAASGTQFTIQYLSHYFGHRPEVLIVGIMEATLAWLDADEPFAQLTLAVFLASQSDRTIQSKLDTSKSKTRSNSQKSVKYVAKDPFQSHNFNNNEG